MRKWLRIKLQDKAKEYDDMHLGVLVDEDGCLVENVPFCEWWGAFKSTDLMPFVYRQKPDKNWYIDFGSDPEDDQDERYHLFSLAVVPIERGRSCVFRWDDQGIDMYITAVSDLVAGTAAS